MGDQKTSQDLTAMNDNFRVVFSQQVKEPLQTLAKKNTRCTRSHLICYSPSKLLDVRCVALFTQNARVHAKNLDTKLLLSQEFQTRSDSSRSGISWCASPSWNWSARSRYG